SRPAPWSAGWMGWMISAISWIPHRAICRTLAGCCWSMVGSRPGRCVSCSSSGGFRRRNPGWISADISASEGGNVMVDQQLLRYRRQNLLTEIDADGQQRLLDSGVLIVGMGGLGGPAAVYMAGDAVGTLLLADDDH